ncbi:MAG TPA: FKBP-type peptidyl-prolyl cis-trans isomerase [Longimicrobium sp.]|nr:FKBP-type peptidyl-prolyl cis-trans isomerase [Longimicrobium sp.]
MRRMSLALLCALSLLSAACDASPTEPTIENTEFASSLGVDLSQMTKTSSGLYYRDLAVGTGAVVQSGQTVGVYYRGWFPNGTQFDSRVTGQPPFSFRVGTGQVITGWDQGIPGMRVGGRRQLVVPPSLGYGPVDYGLIPGNSILVFEVQVVSAS